VIREAGVTDELSAPLGQERKPKRRAMLPKALARILAGLLAVVLVGFAAWTIVAHDPLGGEPFAVASTTASAPAESGGQARRDAVKPASSHPAVVTSAGASDAQTVTIINGMNGKREQVALGGAASVIAPPAAGGVTAPATSAPAPAAANAVSVDAGLIDPLPQGGIPKIGAHGARASEVYASPNAKAAAAAAGPHIAIVVGRLGISANGTAEALAKLPAAVTFAFTPYGVELDRWVGRARGEGHEVLLQVPMEPFDYPDNDPGPQTLLTTLSPAQNADRLHWAMSRFQGYVGIAPYMGGRLVTNAQVMAPITREVATRGLIYFDDGATARSAPAGDANGSYAKADVAIGAAFTPTAIDAALARLEKIARERGSAVGSATAGPATIERISTWAKNLAKRGVTLVPLTAVVNKPKSS
jgi:hypothetical protein